MKESGEPMGKGFTNDFDLEAARFFGTRWVRRDPDSTKYAVHGGTARGNTQ